MVAVVEEVVGGCVVAGGSVAGGVEEFVSGMELEEREDI